jgi:hypothetical protein
MPKLFKRPTTKRTMENDLESAPTFTPLKSILIKPDEEKNIHVKDRVLRFVVVFIFCIFMLPLIFCDYYFAINNDCLKQKLPISLTMYDYLIVNAALSSFMLLSLSFVLLFGFKLDEDSSTVLAKVFGMMANLFVVSWLVTGGIMYWGEMDRTLCSSQVNNYLTATLILRIVLIGLEIIKRYK